jgi:DNA-directed RNA polymerase subunit M/transcription elongation factor TFIIS
MKFCADCKNMLYTIEEGEAGIKLKCRKCPYFEAAPALLYEHNLREDTTAKLATNPYLVQDPTLPRFTTVQCPNETCPSRGKESDVVGVKIDKENVVWMYQCAYCLTSWKQASRRG